MHHYTNRNMKIHEKTLYLSNSYLTIRIIMMWYDNGLPGSIFICYTVHLDISFLIDTSKCVRRVPHCSWIGILLYVFLSFPLPNLLFLYLCSVLFTLFYIRRNFICLLKSHSFHFICIIIYMVDYILYSYFDVTLHQKEKSNVRSVFVYLT